LIKKELNYCPKFHNIFTGQNAIEDQFLKQCSKTSMKNIDIIDIMNIDIMLIEPNHPVFLARIIINSFLHIPLHHYQWRQQLISYIETCFFHTI